MTLYQLNTKQIILRKVFLFLTCIYQHFRFVNKNLNKKNKNDEHPQQPDRELRINVVNQSPLLPLSEIIDELPAIQVETQQLCS